MTIESAVSFFVAIFIFGITPGPGIFAILARALSEGAARCFWLGLGMAVSDILYLIMACLGLAALAVHWESLFVVVRWVGAAYLLYLGYKLWRAPVDPQTAPPTRGQGMSFVQGFLISASNPKVIFFYIAFLPGFMDLTRLDAGDIALASALTLVSLMSGIMMIAFFAARARLLLRSAHAVRRLNRTAAGIMGGAGIWLASRG